MMIKKLQTILGTIALLLTYVFIQTHAVQAQTGTTSGVLRSVGSIDCFGRPGTGEFGTVVVDRTNDQLTVSVTLTGGLPNWTFSIELWEADPGCYPDDNGDTGVRLTTDSSGNGSALVILNLPYSSLGGAILGDGSGTEQIVVGLDRGLSQGSGGDTYATEPISLPDGEENSAPTANAGGPYIVDEGASINLDGSNSSDPDEDAASITYEWDLDYDGSVFNVDKMGSAPSVSYSDNFPARIIALRVTDSGGLSDLATTTLAVNNVAPTATFANISGEILQGETATLEFSNQSDPSSDDTNVGFYYSYDCTNDGGFEVSKVSTGSFDCLYPDSGNFTAQGRIEDKDGGFTEYTSAVTVLSPAEATVDLIDMVEDLNFEEGIENSLDKKLENAQNALEDMNSNNNSAAINKFQAFINEVEAQRDKKITDDQANMLIAWADRIIESLSP